MPGLQPAQDRGGANLQRLRPDVADLEPNGGPLRRHNRLIHQEVLAALDHTRNRNMYTAQPDGLPAERPVRRQRPGTTIVVTFPRFGENDYLE